MGGLPLKIRDWSGCRKPLSARPPGKALQLGFQYIIELMSECDEVAIGLLCGFAQEIKPEPTSRRLGECSFIFRAHSHVTGQIQGSRQCPNKFLVLVGIIPPPTMIVMGKVQVYAQFGTPGKKQTKHKNRVGPTRTGHEKLLCFRSLQKGTHTCLEAVRVAPFAERAGHPGPIQIIVCVHYDLFFYAAVRRLQQALLFCSFAPGGSS